MASTFRIFEAPAEMRSWTGCAVGTEIRVGCYLSLSRTAQEFAVAA